MQTQFILLVEDDPGDEMLALRAFDKNQLPVTITVVRDGAQALDFLLARGPYAQRDVFHQPRVILLDLKLPKIDGLEVLRQIRSHPSTQLLPVVVLTSSNEEDDIRRSYLLGANSYLRKPINFDQFLTTVRLLATYWLDLNEYPPLGRNS